MATTLKDSLPNGMQIGRSKSAKRVLRLKLFTRFTLKNEDTNEYINVPAAAEQFGGQVTFIE
ncbi:hypothetical protein [uncultured Sulfitobacter sp.]|jgi:hypothetical protein|uniref:hypothetical protein n=1 Tax=uncultured Sulfitobacter sp. TaxID=191468 RepID=UPI002596D120|nr:hypothetical protein [uncultured Sulfitobacter sp.]|tara:strand:- start:668 stop:853 length:186 start_codon:yes stop_codon:yes gene_type:complete